MLMFYNTLCSVWWETQLNIYNNVNSFVFIFILYCTQWKQYSDRTVVSQPETHPSDIHDEEDEEDEETEDEASIGVPWNRSEM